MRKRYLIPLFLIITSSLWGQSEFFNTVSFKNNTGSEIWYLFFSPADSEYWGPDVLGDSTTFLSGEELEFFISYPDETNNFDFMAIDEKGNVYEIYEEPITDGDPALIVINKKYRTDTIDMDSLAEQLIGLEILNETGVELTFLFVSPSDSEMYGIDFMDSYTTLPDGNSLQILLFRNDVEIEYDIMGMDENDNSYSFTLTLDPDYEQQYVSIEESDLD